MRQDRKNRVEWNARSTTAEDFSEGLWFWIRCRCDVAVGVLQRLLPFAEVRSDARLGRLLHVAESISHRGDEHVPVGMDRG